MLLLLAAILNVSLGLATVAAASEVRASSPQDAPADQIVAVVNDNVITMADVVGQMRVLSGGSDLAGLISDEDAGEGQQVQRLYQEAIKQLINEEMIYTEAQRRQFVIPSEYIERQIGQEVGRYAGGDWQKYRELLGEAGMTLDERREKLRRQITVRQFLNSMIHQRVQIAPKQVLAYYEANPERFSTTGEVRMEVMVLSGSAHDEAARSKRFAAVRDGVAQGRSFLELAKQEGDATESSWRKPEELPPAMRDAIANLSAGQLAEPFAIGDNWFLIHVAEVKPGETRTFEDARERIAAMLRAEEGQRRLNELMERLRRRTSIRFPGT